MKQSPFALGIITFIAVSVLFFRCQNQNNGPTSNNILWIKNTHAKLFRLGTTEIDSFLEVFQANENRVCIGKFFWGKSQSIQGYQKIKTIQRMASMSAIHSSILCELGLAKQICGIESKTYVSHSALTKSIHFKTMVEFAPSGPIIPEKLALLKPDLLIGYTTNEADKTMIERLGNRKFPVIWCNNHLENHPLGRAEWIVALGWITHKPQFAQAIFNGVKSRYDKIVKQASAIAIAPKVATNLCYNGNWYVPQLQSYLTQTIIDAGGQPLTLRIQGSSSNMIGIEKAIELFKNADIWINPDLCTSIRCIGESDPRVGYIKAFKNKKIYHYNLHTNAKGTNPYWDMGCIYPDRILSDLFAIFHSQLDANKTTYYYQLCTP